MALWSTDEPVHRIKFDRLEKRLDRVRDRYSLKLHVPAISDRPEVSHAIADGTLHQLRSARMQLTRELSTAIAFVVCAAAAGSCSDPKTVGTDRVDRYAELSAEISDEGCRCYGGATPSFSWDADCERDVRRRHARELADWLDCAIPELERVRTCLRGAGCDPDAQGSCAQDDGSDCADTLPDETAAAIERELNERCDIVLLCFETPDAGGGE